MVNIEKAGARPAGVVTGDDSVISAKYKSSMENLINRVAVIDGKSELVMNVDSEDAQYGTVQKVYKHDDQKKDAMEEAKTLPFAREFGKRHCPGRCKFYSRTLDHSGESKCEDTGNVPDHKRQPYIFVRTAYRKPDA